MPRLAELLAYFNCALVIMPEQETAFHNDINVLQMADVRQGIASSSASEACSIESTPVPIASRPADVSANISHSRNSGCQCEFRIDI